jgi:hypothetical protein
MTLWRTFRSDRLFAVLFVLLLVCAWLPLRQTPFLPFIDLQNNVGGASMIVEAATGGPMSKYYEVNWHPVPYWTGYMIMGIVSHFAGTLFAAKFICGLLSFILPLSVVRFLIATGRHHRQGLWAFLLVWDRNLYAGWVSYLLGMAIALYTLAWLIEMKTWRSVFAITAMSGLVALTHIQALAFLAVAGITLVLTQKPSIKRVFMGTVALSGGLLGVWPWITRMFENIPVETAKEAFQFKWDTPREKMAGFYDFTFGSFGGVFDTRVPTFAFGLLILGPLLWSMLRRTMPRAQMWPPLVVLFSCLVLYLTLPFSIYGPIFHKHNYVRYGTFVLLGMLLVPKPRFEGRAAWALLPGIIMALRLDMHVAKQLRDVGLRVRPFQEIVANIKPHSKILPVVNEYSDPACQMPPFNQLHSYAAGATRSFDPLFFDNKFTPILYKPEGRPPFPFHAKLDYEHFIRHYDYILIQGLGRDPFHDKTIPAPVVLIKEAGIWRLYGVNKR